MALPIILWLYSFELSCFLLQALTGECGFLAANLYARSIFGEDALANVSVEKPFGAPDAKVQGHVRIRAKTQVQLWLMGSLCTSNSVLP